MLNEIVACPDGKHLKTIDCIFECIAGSNGHVRQRSAQDGRDPEVRGDLRQVRLQEEAGEAAHVARGVRERGCGSNLPICARSPHQERRAVPPGSSCCSRFWLSLFQEPIVSNCDSGEASFVQEKLAEGKEKKLQ